MCRKRKSLYPLRNTSLSLNSVQDVSPVEVTPFRVSGRRGVSDISFTVLHPERIAQLVECLSASTSIAYIVQPCMYALHHRNAVKTHFTAYLLVADSQVSAEYPSGVLCKHHIHLAGPDVLRRYPVNLTGFQLYSFYCLVHIKSPLNRIKNVLGYNYVPSARKAFPRPVLGGLR